jgi:hypothetical protein
LIVASLLLQDPPHIFDDVAGLATASNPKAMDSLDQMEQALHLNLRHDLLARLGGEITVELDTIPPQNPVWKVFLKTTDPPGLLETLRTLFAASRMMPVESEQDGISYYTLRIPNANKTMEIGYAIADGYLVVASSRDAVADAIRLHRGGESLAKSGKLATYLPQSASGTDVSALLYEDPIAMAALNLQRISPELANSLIQRSVDAPPTVMAFYGDESALREASGSSGLDVTTPLIVSAIAIPNLLRARMAANDSSAVAIVRTANTAEITYEATYPQNGYAPDFAATRRPDRVDAGQPNLHCGNMVRQVRIPLHHHNRMQTAEVPRICGHGHSRQQQHRNPQFLLDIRRGSEISARFPAEFPTASRRVPNLATPKVKGRIR